MPEMFLQGHISKYPELLEMLFPTYLPDPIFTWQVTKAKLDVN
jgi:hypothetical protein